MTDDEMQLDLLVAELEQENRLLRARNERLQRTLDKIAENARELGIQMELPEDYK